MTPMEAIQTATRNAAEALRMEREIGTLEPGKRADLILVNGNPAEDIRVLQPRENIMMVMRDGKVFVDRREGREKRVIGVEYGSWALSDG